MGAHGLAWDVSDEYQTLYAQNGTIDNPELLFLMAVQAFYECKEACNAVLTLSSCTNGKLAVRSWKAMEEKQVFLVLKRTQKVANKKRLPSMIWFANRALSLAL